MPETALAKAQRKLALWEAAEDAIAEGQGYQMGKTALTRADLAQVHKMVDYYTDQVSRLAAGRGAGGRVRRIIPQDL